MVRRRVCAQDAHLPIPLAHVHEVQGGRVEALANTTRRASKARREVRLTRRSRWRLDLAQQAIRTAEKHLDAGRMEHFKRSCAFAREMLKDENLAEMSDGAQFNNDRPDCWQS